MSVAMTNCGRVGWISDKHGYRYAAADPATGAPWPSMPPALARIAATAARRFGDDKFEPDACLINRYGPGAKLSLHQDVDEEDFSFPVVSLSIGAPASFLIGGENRSDPTIAILLEEGDALVFGRTARRAYHGVRPLKAGGGGLLGGDRMCLTFRRALARPATSAGEC